MLELKPRFSYQNVWQSKCDLKRELVTKSGLGESLELFLGAKVRPVKMGKSRGF